MIVFAVRPCAPYRQVCVLLNLTPFWCMVSDCFCISEIMNE